MGAKVVSSSYFSSLWALFTATIKSVGWWFCLVVLLDLLFYLGVYGAGYATFMHIQQEYSSLEIPDPTQIIAPEQAQMMLDKAKSFYYSTLGMLTLLALFVILWWTLLKGFIWSTILKQPLSARLFGKLFLFNMVWLGSWLLLFALMGYVFNLVLAPYFMLGLLVFFVMLTNTIYVFFISQPEWISVKKGVLLCLKKFHLLIVPYVMLFAIYMLLSRPFSLVQHISVQTFLLAFTLGYIALARSYLIAITQHLEKENL